MTTTTILAGEQRVYSTELREVDTEDRTMTGVAAPYGETVPIGSRFLETLAPGCFAKSIKEAARGLPLMAMHKGSEWPVGRSIAWEETPTGLVGTWRFDSRAEAREVHRLAKEGMVSGLSVSFQSLDDEEDERDGVVHFTRRAARLLEVSLVPMPAYPSAQITHVRSATVAGMLPPGLDIAALTDAIEAERARRAAEADAAAQAAAETPKPVVEDALAFLNRIRGER